MKIQDNQPVAMTSYLNQSVQQRSPMGAASDTAQNGGMASAFDHKKFAYRIQKGYTPVVQHGQFVTREMRKEQATDIKKTHFTLGYDKDAHNKREVDNEQRWQVPNNPLNKEELMKKGNTNFDLAQTRVQAKSSPLP